MKGIYYWLCGFGLALLLGTGSAVAQDFHLSMYDAPPMFLNPAMTGMFNGSYRIHGQYRSQWASIATKPFTTAALSYDMPISKFGAGIQILNNRAGAGNYNVLSATLSGSFDQPLNKAKTHHLALGIQAGILQKSVDVNKLSWGNQYSTTYTSGGGFDPTLSTGENFASQSFVMEDLNAGLIYYYGKESSRVNPFVGGSVMHITQPTESFMGVDNPLPMRYVIHGGAKVNITERIQLLPKFITLYQTNDREMTASLIGHFYFKDADSYLIFGPTFRLSGPIFLEKDNPNFYGYERDAAVVEGGIKIGHYLIRFAYDINTSTLNTYTNGKGGVEFSLTYTAPRKAPAAVPNCPGL